jgi:hypothetical protein
MPTNPALRPPTNSTRMATAATLEDMLYHLEMAEVPIGSPEIET